MPFLRQISLTAMPVSASFKIEMIWVSVNHDHSELPASARKLYY